MSCTPKGPCVSFHVNLIKSLSNLAVCHCSCPFGRGRITVACRDGNIYTVKNGQAWFKVLGAQTASYWESEGRH